MPSVYNRSLKTRIFLKMFSEDTLPVTESLILRLKLTLNPVTVPKLLSLTPRVLSYIYDRNLEETWLIGMPDRTATISLQDHRIRRPDATTCGSSLRPARHLERWSASCEASSVAQRALAKSHRTHPDRVAHVSAIPRPNLF